MSKHMDYPYSHTKGNSVLKAWCLWYARENTVTKVYMTMKEGGLLGIKYVS